MTLLQVNEVLALDKGPEGLLEILATSTDIPLLAEVAWVLCYAAFSQTNLNRLVHLGLISAMLPQLNNCLKEVTEL